MERESKITILATLKNFYDEEIFGLFIKELYNEDQEVSLAAIRSSASIGNEAAIPHLYRIIETGSEAQKIESIRALAEIKAPSSVERLIKYFNLLEERNIKEELLAALNRIAAFSEAVQDLDKAVLVSSLPTPRLLEHAVMGLLSAKNLSSVRSFLEKAEPDLQAEAFRTLLEAGDNGASSFIESFQEMARDFAPEVLGVYLAAYEIRVANTKQNFVLEHLKNPHPDTVKSFVRALTDFGGALERPRQMFRIMLILPSFDLETEGMIGDLVERIVKVIKRRFPHLLSHVGLMVSTHLETVFGKIRKQYLSIKDIKGKTNLLIVLFAKLLEKYASPDLLSRVQKFFQESLLGKPEPLVREIGEALKDAPEEDRNRLKACLPLFQTKDTKIRILISSNLSYINFDRPHLTRRLNRLVRKAGSLTIKTAIKKIAEILRFAREERIDFLEQTCVVTLCQLYHRQTIEDFRSYLTNPKASRISLNGYCRGARFLPPRVLFSPLIGLLGHKDLPAETRDIIIDSLHAWDLKDVKNALPALIGILKLPHLSRAQKEKLGEVITYYASGSDFQPLIDLTASSEKVIRLIAIQALRNLASTNKNILLDVLTNRLYVLLDSESQDIQIHSLLALVDLGDDYAFQVFQDHLSSQRQEYTAKILSEIGDNINHELVTPILETVDNPGRKVQESLRQTLSHMSHGPYGEEVRQFLAARLKGTRREVGQTQKQEVPARSAVESSLLEHAKIEFKFKRENSQILTVFFIDMVGYTARTSASDTSTLIDLIKAFENIVIPDIEHFKGSLIKKMGDGILAVFKHPLNAAAAALSVQQKISMYNQYRVGKEKFSVRIGLNTGLVIRKDSDIYGDTVNVASRMETSANPGEILLTQTTFEEIKEYVNCTPLGSIQVKGKSAAIMSYSAVSMKEGFGEAQEIGTASDAKRTEGKSEDVSLTDLLISPDYSLPGECAVDPRVAKLLQDLFGDITTAVEEISRDYREENAFKKYLQLRWSELVDQLKSPG